MLGRAIIYVFLGSRANPATPQKPHLISTQLSASKRQFVAVKKGLETIWAASRGSLCISGIQHKHLGCGRIAEALAIENKRHFPNAYK
jgi:hypothetical protein